MSEGRCAFEGCQAGGVILPRAPLYVAWSGDEYRPGCWAVESRRVGEALARSLDRLVPTPPPLPAAILVSRSEDA